MSEIKGQLLGVLLAAIIFGLVGGGIYAIFTTLTASVETKANEVIDGVGAEPAPAAYIPERLLTY